MTLRDLRDDPSISSAQVELYSDLRELAGSSLWFEPPTLRPEDPKVEAQILGFSRKHRLAARRLRLTVDSSTADLRRRARRFSSAPERA